MKTIFLIDDDPVFVYLTRRIIHSVDSECTIREFADGELAMHELQAICDGRGEPPDIIFVDLSMPVMDGWDFLKEYDQLSPRIGKKIQVFIVSSSISPQEVERSRTFRSVIDFLIKPVAKGKIADIVLHP